MLCSKQIGICNTNFGVNSKSSNQNILHLGPIRTSLRVKKTIGNVERPVNKFNIRTAAIKAEKTVMVQSVNTVKPGYVDTLTAEQQNVLGELIKALPTAFAEASVSGEDLILWTVDLNSLSLEDATPSRSQSVVLLKFLRARSFDVDKALDMLVNCLKWRREFGISKLDTETHPAYLDKCGTVAGRDKHGNPVTYNFYGGMDMHEVFGGADGPDGFVRWRIWLMERAVRELNFEKGVEHVMQVHDYEGASMRREASVKQASRKIISLFQDYYPEFLPAKLFVSVPKVMEVVFSLFSAFSDAATRAKFSMVGAGRTRYALLQLIDATQLPKRYGGFLELGVAATDAPPVTVKPGGRFELRRVVEEPETLLWGVCSDWSEVTINLTFTPEDAAAPAAVTKDAEGVVSVVGRYSESLKKEAAAGQIKVLSKGEVKLEVEAPGGFFASESNVSCLLKAIGV